MGFRFLHKMKGNLKELSAQDAKKALFSGIRDAKGGL